MACAHLLNSVPTDFTVVGEASTQTDALPLVLEQSPGRHCVYLVRAGRNGDETGNPDASTWSPLFLADTLNDTILLSAAVSTGAHGYVLQDAGSKR